MDNSLLAQILFANENAFRNINDANKCHMIAGVCRVAKENEHLINAIDKNRVELYANRIFNYLLNHIYNSNSTKGDVDTIDNEFSMNFADSISTMLNKQKLCYRNSFAEFILLDYIKILNHTLYIIVAIEADIIIRALLVRFSHIIISESLLRF